MQAHRFPFAYHRFHTLQFGVKHGVPLLGDSVVSTAALTAFRTGDLFDPASLEETLDRGVESGRAQFEDRVKFTDVLLNAVAVPIAAA